MKRLLAKNVEKWSTEHKKVEINNIVYNKGKKIYPPNQVNLDCIMPSIPLKHKCLSIILICVTPGRVVQSVTCLATDACLTAIPGLASSIPARSQTFVEIDHNIISMVILLPSAVSFKKGCCQLQAKVCAQITGYPLVQASPGKSMVRWTDRPAMTIAVDLGRKATKQTKWYVSLFHISSSGL